MCTLNLSTSHLNPVPSGWYIARTIGYNIYLNGLGVSLQQGKRTGELTGTGLRPSVFRGAPPPQALSSQIVL